MEEFEITRGFEASAQSLPFSPVETVDYISGLERNAKIEYDNMERRRQQVLDEMDREEKMLSTNNLARLEQIAQISQSGFELLNKFKESMYKHQTDEGIAEAMDDADSADINSENYRRLEQARMEGEAAYQEEVTRQEKMGVPPDLIAKLRGKSGHAAYGYKVGLAMAAGTNYMPFMLDAFANDDKTKVTVIDEETGEEKTITPMSAQTRAEKAAVFQALLPVFSRSSGLSEIGAGIRNEFALKNMRKTRATILNAAGEQDLERAQLDIRNTVDQGLMSAGADGVNREGLMQNSVKMLVTGGGGMSHREASVHVYKMLLKIHESDPENFTEAKLKQMLAAKTHTGKSFADMYPREFIKVDQDIADAKSRANALEDQQEQLSLREQLENILPALQRDGISDEGYKDLGDQLREAYPLQLQAVNNFMASIGQYRDSVQDRNQQVKDAYSLGNDLTTEVLNRDFPRAADDAELKRRAELGDKHNGKLGSQKKLGLELIENAFGSVKSEAGLSKSDDYEHYSFALAQAQAEKELDKVAANLMRANPDMSWETAYLEGAKSIEQQIREGTGIYTRTGVGPATRFTSGLYQIDSRFKSTKDSEKLDKQLTANAFVGRSALRTNRNNLFSKEEIEALAANPTAGSPGFFKIKSFVNRYNTQNPKGQITTNEAISDLASGAGVEFKPPKDEFEEGARLNNLLHLLNNPTSSRVNRVAVVTSNPPVKIRSGDAGWGDVSQAAIAYGLDPAIAPLASVVWAIESKHGRTQSGANNLFGIKGKGTVRTTQEQGPNGKYTTEAEFADYPTRHASVAAFVDLMKTPRYAEVLKAKTPGDALRALKAAGYATDDNYVNLGLRVLRDYGVDPTKPYQSEPLIPDQPWSNPALMGRVSKAVLTGNTGKSKGPHTHFQLMKPVGGKMVAVDPREALALVQVNGKPILHQFDITSGFSPARYHPVDKVVKPHRGIDVATPPGMRLTLRGATYIEPVYDPTGGGKVAVYGLANGYEMWVMHLSDNTAR